MFNKFSFKHTNNLTIQKQVQTFHHNYYSNENNIKKLAPCETDGRLLRNLRPFQVLSHVTQN